MFGDLEFRGHVRPATEEFNFAGSHHPQDVTNAEFMRTFRNVTLPGGQLVRRLKDEMQREAERIVLKVRPSQKMQVS